MTKPEAISKHNPSLRGKTCMCIYGNPGVQKTRTICTSENPLIIRPPTDHMDAVDREVDEWVVRDHDDLFEVYEYLRTLSPKQVEWDWVWLDSVSLYQDHDVDFIHENTVARNPSRKGSPIDQSEWASESRETARWVRHMVALAKDYELFNFGFTAHVMPQAMPPDDDLLLMPVIRGKNMPSKLCGYMNIVAYMEIKDGKRVLRTQATDKWYAKDQYGAWPDGRVIEPSMPKIQKAIAETRKVTNVTTARRTRRRRAA